MRELYCRADQPPALPTFINLFAFMYTAAAALAATDAGGVFFTTRNM